MMIKIKSNKHNVRIQFIAFCILWMFSAPGGLYVLQNEAGYPFFINHPGLSYIFVHIVTLVILLRGYGVIRDCLGYRFGLWIKNKEGIKNIHSRLWFNLQGKYIFRRFITDTGELIIRELEEKHIPVSMESHLLTVRGADKRLIRQVKKHWPDVTVNPGQPENITWHDRFWIVTPSLLLYWRPVSFKKQKIRVTFVRF
ncbi:hypothetical protein [Mangrovibacter phragmitis]|uniref:hypothetical protein n=1 Tax=Mangrovibacter phragmitis TaxID=1691903 RepID=UPI00351859EE